IRDDEIEQKLALRRQQRRINRPLRRDVLDIIGDKPLQKGARLWAGDAQNTPFRQDRSHQSVHVSALSAQASCPGSRFRRHTPPPQGAAPWQAAKAPLYSAPLSPPRQDR